MAKRIILTAAEIQAVLAVAKNTLAEETFEDPADEAEAEKQTAAYYRGIDKLQQMLEQREIASEKRGK